MTFQNINPDRRVAPCLLPLLKMLSRKYCSFLLVFTLALWLPAMADTAKNDEFKTMTMKMGGRHQQEMAELRKHVQELSQNKQPAVKKSPIRKLSAAKDFFVRLQILGRSAKPAPTLDKETSFTSIELPAQKEGLSGALIN
jgi:hypothetical protein